MASTNQVPPAEARQQFVDEMVQTLGYGPRPDDLIDGKIVRFSTRNGDPHDDAGWCVWHGDYNPVPAGAFGDYRNGDGTHYWHLRTDRRYTTEECADYHRQMAERRKQLAAAEAKRHEEARQKAIRMLEKATDDPADHPYPLAKGVKPHAGIRRGRADVDYPGFDPSDCLFIPLVDIDGIMHSLQLIDRNGVKRYLKGGRKKGCHFAIGDRSGDGEVLIGDTLNIAEGYSTTATVYEGSGDTSIMAGDSGNILAVAQAFRDRFPDVRIKICGDDDHKTDGNPGLTKAREAALAVRGYLAVPTEGFGQHRENHDTDFNDLMRRRGLAAVRTAIANAEAPPPIDGHPRKPNGAASPNEDPRNGATTTGTSTRAYTAANEIWPIPQPLIEALEPADYPTDALPETIRGAVEEVVGFVKAPIPLAASSALSVLSTASQAYVDVARTDRLTGPTSVYMLTIADSGERKSTCDDFFSNPLRDYDKDQAARARTELQRYAAEIATWQAERDGILNSIRQNGRKGQSVDGHRERLTLLEQKQPTRPRVPQLIRGDDTPENLAWALSHDWPSAGVITAEAGIVFGAHAMGTDSVMRNLSLLNILWDGGVLPIGRRSSESFTVRGARLTIGLQVQELTLRAFFDKSKGLARGTGFLARPLLSWPQSTQGYRPYSEPPKAWPLLTKFNARIAEILKMKMPIDDDGALTPAMLWFSADAKAGWITFHDAIEADLRMGGELFDVKDVASKAADNAARLAALFHMSENGPQGAISLKCLEGASRIAAWHLHESRRFFGELALPPELVGASRLDVWLIDYCRRKRTDSVPRREAQQFGPLREKAELDAALRELTNADRMRVVKKGHRIDIRVNPALLEGDITA